MTRLTISLPDEQRAYLQQAVASGQYASESEVLRDMIRERQRNQARETLTAKLLEGLDGEDIDLTPQEMADIWKEARDKVRRQKR
jgi:antitoxin ParD1/3/4